MMEPASFSHGSTERPRLAPATGSNDAGVLLGLLTRPANGLGLLLGAVGGFFVTAKTSGWDLPDSGSKVLSGPRRRPLER